MKTLLVIDTATDICAVACLYKDRVFQDTRSVHRSHNTQLLGMLDGLCRRAGIAPRAFSAIGFVAGPGSFTGIRIAASVSQALRQASGATLLALSSADILAVAALSGHFGDGFSGRRLITILPSRRDRYYCAQFTPQLGTSPDAQTGPSGASARPRMEVVNRLLDGAQVVREVRDAQRLQPVAVVLGHGVDLAGLAGLFDAQREVDFLLQPQPVRVGCEALLRYARDIYRNRDETHSASVRSSIDAAEDGRHSDAIAPASAAAEQLLAGLPIYVEGDTPWQPK